jgi:hypothetical protein
MKTKFIIPAALIALATSTAMAHAGSWSHNGTATGPNGGQVTQQGGGTCNASGCVRAGTVTGPQGNTVVRGRVVRVK